MFLLDYLVTKLKDDKDYMNIDVYLDSWQLAIAYTESIKDTLSEYEIFCSTTYAEPEGFIRFVRYWFDKEKGEGFGKVTITVFVLRELNRGRGGQDVIYFVDLSKEKGKSVLGSIAFPLSSVGGYSYIEILNKNQNTGKEFIDLVICKDENLKDFANVNKVSEGDLDDLIGKLEGASI